MFLSLSSGYTFPLKLKSLVYKCAVVVAVVKKEKDKEREKEKQKTSRHKAQVITGKHAQEVCRSTNTKSYFLILT